MKRTANKQPKAAPNTNSQSRNAILASALKTFARDGFGGASLPQIAKAAQVAPPLIYYYFGSKENLWKETIDYSMSGIIQEANALRNATRALAPLDRLRALLHAFTQFAAHSPDFVAMVMSETRSQSGRFEWAQENYSNVLLKENISILEDAKKRGDIRDFPPEQMAYALFGGILFYFTVTQDLPDGKALDKIAADYAESVFSMFLERLATKPA